MSIRERVNLLEYYEKDKDEIRNTGVTISRKLDALYNLISNLAQCNMTDKIILDTNQLINTVIHLRLKVMDALDFKNVISHNEFDEELQNLDGVKLVIDELRKEVNRIQQLESNEPGKLVDSLNTINEKLSNITKYEVEHSKKSKLYNLINLLYNTFSEIKKREIQSIYREIQSDIEIFYSFIHPGEDHNEIQLIVDLTKKSNSVDIKMKSFQKEVDPRAYQSEGHLDSLGLCVFLAYIKKFNTDCNLLILDDIVSTIDSNHRNRICELIFEKFPEKQIIITTHDQIWYDQIVTTQKKFNIQNEFKNYSITKWDIHTGVDLIPYKTRPEIIQKKLDDADKHGAGNEIRRYLEYILSEACHRLSAKVPYRKNGKYTLNDYFENFEMRIVQLKLYTNPEWKDSLLQILNQVNSQRSIINMLSHYDEKSNNIPINEIEEILITTRELERILSCTGCESMLAYDQSSKFIRCINSKCKDKIIYK